MTDWGSTTEADAAAYEDAHHSEPYDPIAEGFDPCDDYQPAWRRSAS